MTRLGPTVMVTLAACAADATHPTSEPPASLFDRVLAIELDVDPTAWAALRRETRSWADIYGSCLTGPFASPFNVYEARAEIDGESLGTIALRKRGFLGSLSDEKPSLKLSKLSLSDGTTELLLNNAVQDPSYMRQCLAYRVFAAAGVPAPRCGFARVRVNGEDLGLYVNVEKVGVAFVTRHFARADGALYEGTFSDFRAGWTETFDHESGLSADGEIDAVAAALARPDAELLAAVDALVDVDAFLTYWALEAIVGHRDGYAANANNFYVYRDPADGRFDFIPWGTDTTFRISPTARSFLPWRLSALPPVREAYARRVRELLDVAWDEAALVAEIDRLEALIAPVAGVDEVRAFVVTRRARLLAELDDGRPLATASPLEPPCFDVVGEAHADFTTRWGTLDANALAAGDATVALTVDGAMLDVLDAGAVAGLDPADATRAQLRVLANLTDGTAVLLVLQLEASALRAGATVELDGLAATGHAYRYTPGVGLTTLAQMPLGTLEILEASTVSGGSLRARFNGPLVRL